MLPGASRQACDVHQCKHRERNLRQGLVMQKPRKSLGWRAGRLQFKRDRDLIERLQGRATRIFRGLEHCLIKRG